MTDYIQLHQLKASIDKQGNTHDVSMAHAITAASRLIDRLCGRPENFFVADTTATARVYTGSGETVQWIAPCVAITLVAVKSSPTDTTYTSWATTDWIAATGDPEYPDFTSLPYQFIMVDPSGVQSHFISGKYSAQKGFPPDRDHNPRMRGAPTVQITAKWGYSVSVPPTIEQACLIQAARWYKRALSSFGDTLANPEMGQMFYTKPMDPDIKTLLLDGRMIMPAIGGRPK